MITHEFHIQRTLLGAHSVLMWHGVSAMLAMIALGSVLPFHLKAGLKSKKKLWSGLCQLVFLTTLFISGALLYYGPAKIRDIVIATHWMTGLAFFTLFLLHVVYSKKNSRLNYK